MAFHSEKNISKNHKIWKTFENYVQLNIEVKKNYWDLKCVMNKPYHLTEQ